MMSIAGAGSRLATKPIPRCPTGRLSLASTPARRQTTTVLGDRTNPRLTREKTSLKPSLNKTSTSSTSNPGKKKIPAWDMKGRLEEMAKLMSQTTERMNKMENEKASVEADLDVKREVVEQSSEQIKAMRNKMEESERELEAMRKSLKDKEDFFSEETVKLRRKLEDEEYAKSSLERKVRGLEDELNSKMTEIAGLKTSV